MPPVRYFPAVSIGFFLLCVLILIFESQHSPTIVNTTARLSSSPLIITQVPQTAAARIAYFITVAAEDEIYGLERMLTYTYDPRNLYLVHLDSRASSQTRGKVQMLLNRFYRSSRSNGADSQVDQQQSNLILMQNPLSVAWGGLSLLLASVYGMASAIQYLDKVPWEYWINLSPSDMPLMTQQEIMTLLGEPGKKRLSFISGQRIDWNATHEGFDRREAFYDDAQMYQLPNGPPPKDFRGDYPYPRPIGKGTVRRTIPNSFEIYKSEFWVILHREMVEYIVHSYDNTARILLAYLSSSMIPDELFFGTLSCHPQRKKDLPIVSVPLRYVHWYSGNAHPSKIDEKLIAAAVKSGCLFARKFRNVAGKESIPKSIEWLDSYFKDDSSREKNMDIARTKMQLRAPDTPERPRFCNEKLQYV